MMHRRHIHVVFRVFVLAMVAARVALAVEATWNSAVEISATVVSTPPFSITLTWPEDSTAAADYTPAYTVFRKSADGKSWGDGLLLPRGQTSFKDEDVVEGSRYEYRVVREFRRPGSEYLDHDGYGYIQTGINVPVLDQRGRVVLVVESSVAEALASKITRLREDLVGDGWWVTQQNVRKDDPVAKVREGIRDEYRGSKEKVEAVFLLGRVPVPRAGRYNPDGHELRPMPSDAYYGDIDGEWIDADGDGVFDSNQIASDVELQVGRVDFAEMDRVGTGKTELELLERYLDKDHAFRHAELRPPRRALISDRIGMDRGRAPAANGYRAFATFFGPENVARANSEDDGDDSERWFSVISKNPYLWTFASGGGAVDSIAYMGTHSEYKLAISSDLATAAKGTFYLLFGSYFVDWSQPNNLMRAALAAPQYGLGAAWAGRPSLYFHHMGLGDTLGFGIRLSQNNDGFYYSPGFPTSWRRHVHVSLMGDPTLRLDYVAPVSAVDRATTEEGFVLTWKASPDVENGPVTYRVYRGLSRDGPFSLATGGVVSEARFVDREPVEGAVYMVRAVQLQKTSSGTYQNASQGVFWPLK